MTIPEQIEAYIADQPEPRRGDLRALHRLVPELMPRCRLWFLDGRDGNGKVVSNPDIGYGVCAIRYADGTSREFYNIGVSANKSGISVYIMGLEDKTYLPKTYGTTIGKATVSGYCIKFRALRDLNIEALESAIRYGASVAGDNQVHR